jgi:hypothetical protein
MAAGGVWLMHGKEAPCAHRSGLFLSDAPCLTVPSFSSHQQCLLFSPTSQILFDELNSHLSTVFNYKEFLNTRCMA